MDSGLCSRRSGFANGSGSYQPRCWSQGWPTGWQFRGRIRSLDWPRSEGVYLSGLAPLNRFWASSPRRCLPSSELSSRSRSWPSSWRAPNFPHGRTFVRSGVTKLAFGLFLATFAYAIVVIVVEGASSSADVLRLAVTLGVLFVLASLVVFVVYVTATMRLLQVSWVVTAVADETRRALRTNRPVAMSYLSAAAPQVDQDPRLVRLKEERDDSRGGQFGVILGVDRGRLWRDSSPGCASRR
jgi:hypothetical protein